MFSTFLWKSHVLGKKVKKWVKKACMWVIVGDKVRAVANQRSEPRSSKNKNHRNNTTNKRSKGNTRATPWTTLNESWTISVD